MQLEEAISFAFERDGLDVLNRPEVLASYVRDLCDTDSDPVAANFVRACDASLLEPFSDAASTGDGAQVAQAAEDALNHLAAEYGMGRGPHPC